MSRKRAMIELPASLVKTVLPTVLAVFGLMVFVTSIADVQLVADVHLDTQLKANKMLDILLNNKNCLGGSAADYHPGLLKEADLVSAKSWTYSTAANCMKIDGMLDYNGHPLMGWGAVVYELPLITKNVSTTPSKTEYEITSTKWSIPSTLDAAYEQPMSDGWFQTNAPNTHAWIAIAKSEKLVTIEKDTTPVEYESGKAVLYLYQLTQIVDNDYIEDNCAIGAFGC